MGLTLLIGGLLALLPIQALRHKSWVLACVLGLLMTSVSLALFADFYQIESLFSLLVLMSAHGVLLRQQLRTHQLLLSVLLTIHFSAAFLTLPISLMILALFLVGLLVLQLLKGESWFLNSALLVIVLVVLLFTVNLSLLVVCCVWLLLMTYRLFLLMTHHPHTIDEDVLFAKIEAAKTTERSRIYQNIHDDVGAELLKLVYQLEHSEQQGQVKTIMKKLREAVASTAYINVTLPQLLQEIISEAETRCALANLQFSHQIELQDKYQLQRLEPVYLQRIIRELINNCLKHARASHINIQATTDNDFLNIIISDDGIGIQNKAQPGKGIKSLQQRVKAKGATISWHARQPSGTQVNLTLRI